MTRRARSCLLWLLMALSIAACRQSLDLDAAPRTAGTPPPGFPTDTGDGNDGILDVAGGVATVNVCVPVTAAAGAALSVDDASLFPAGRRVLLHRAVVFDTAGLVAGQTGDVDPDVAGSFAIARVTSAGGATLLLDEPAPAWAGLGAQVCTIVELERLVVRTSAALAAPVWDGTAGGILAVLVRDEAIVEPGGFLHANGTGLRGGVLSSNGDYGNLSGLEPGALGASSGRGEGLDSNNFGRRGRGVTANGGGGGNSFNASGGGGGNGGAGGEGDGPGNTRGLGGGAVVTPELRLLFGGGGGAGHQDDGNAGVGGAGGGVVFLVVQRLSGEGTIRADGADGAFSRILSGNDGDAAGGGGAGGTVALWAVEADAFEGMVRASGGSGGGVTLGHSPGGGGGGGRVNATTGGEAPGGIPGLRGEDGLPGIATAGAAGVVELP